MRRLLLAVLLAVPLALVGWVRWAAVHDAPKEFVPPEAPRAEDPEPALRKLFEGPLAELKTRAEPAFFDEKTLFDAIDGAAPIFIQRKFRRLVSMELATAGGHELTCDVYDMTDAEHAGSIFEKEKSSQAKTPADWPEALTGPMSLVFHQGRFYVKLTAFDAEAEAALPALGRALREKMR